MRRIEDHAIAGFTHPVEGPKISDEIVVAEAGPAFRKNKLVVAETGQLFRNILHVPRREELAFLYVHHSSGLSRRPQQIRLPAKEGRDLEDVDRLTGDLGFSR
jgi:hypothetical protein